MSKRKTNSPAAAPSRVRSCGCGSKLQSWGQTAGFGCWFHLPRSHCGTFSFGATTVYHLFSAAASVAGAQRHPPGDEPKAGGPQRCARRSAVAGDGEFFRGKNVARGRRSSCKLPRRGPANNLRRGRKSFSFLAGGGMKDTDRAMREQ